MTAGSLAGIRLGPNSAPPPPVEVVRAAGVAATVRRLELIRFPLVLSVIFFHNHFSAIRFGDGLRLAPGSDARWMTTLQDFLSFGLGGIRMPTFFLISGYLFFQGAAAGSGWFVPKLRRRARSLLLPLLLWNLLVLLILLGVQQWESARFLFSGEGPWSRPVLGYGWVDLLDAFVGCQDGYPLVYPLWFLRDVLLMALLAPVYGAQPRWAQWGAIGAFALLWCFNAWPFALPTAQAFVFFYGGAMLAQTGVGLFVLDRYARVTMGLLVFLVLALWSLPSQHALAPVLLRLSHLVGVVGVLTVSKVLLEMPRTSRALAYLSGASFFLFVAHEPLLTVLRKSLVLLSHATTHEAMLLIYFISVAATVLLLLGVHELAKRRAPRVLGWLTGGRGD